MINSWILFRDICKSGASRQKFAQVVVEELAWATSGDDNGKNAVAQRNPLETNEPPEKSEKHVLPQSAVTEQWIRATLSGAQYVANASQKFAQTVLIECNRQVPCFCEIQRFCKQ